MFLFISLCLCTCPRSNLLSLREDGLFPLVGHLVQRTEIKARRGVKGTVNPKMEILSSLFTVMLFQSLTSFKAWILVSLLYTISSMDTKASKKKKQHKKVFILMHYVFWRYLTALCEELLFDDNPVSCNWIMEWTQVNLRIRSVWKDSTPLILKRSTQKE